MPALLATIARYTAAAVGASLAITSTMLWLLGMPVWGNVLFIGFLCPLLIAPPLCLVDIRRRQRLSELIAELESAHDALHHAYARLAEQARLDGLTGLLNRSAWFASAEGEIAGPRALLLLDIDHFKAINDTHGHIAGDHALKSVAAALMKAVGEHGSVGRVGGEEFAVILPGMASQQAAALSERVRRAVLGLRVKSATGRSIRLAVSIGGACCDGRRAFTDLYNEADRNLYVAKNEGRNRVHGLGATPVAA